ncbi:hypothetical protein N7493_008030 [Penicillium malachiteum]|uniref:Uncharacterized protein n=1 Tax=Penicillium malachiteum TaxID=1324776 RepID=A0AAD6HGH6_9EURO|nr:hypothetical protein N7493_008030 [Penicillium malachiteum]
MQKGCGLCLSTDPDGFGGVCPGQAALGSMTNPRNCMPFLFEEMPCLWPNPLIDAAPHVAQKAVFEAAAAPDTDGDDGFEFEFDDDGKDEL